MEFFKKLATIFPKLDLRRVLGTHRKKGIFLFLFSLTLLSAKSVYARELCPFKGEINFLQKNMSLVLGEQGKSSVATQISIISDEDYKLNLNLEGLRTSLFELSTQLESSISLSEDPQRKTSIKGQITSRYSLFNHKPVGEFVGQFEMKNRILYLLSGAMDGINLNGSVELFSPFKINLTLQMNSIPMVDFLSVWVDNLDIHAQGEVSGVIQITGIPGHLLVKGNLFSYDGAVDDLIYDAIVLNLDGQYPVLKLIDSTVTKADGVSFNVSGNFDLSHRGHYREEIAALTKSPLVNEGDSEWEWTIKRKAKAVSTSEFKYFSHKKTSQENPLKEESDVMGVEQKIKF